MNANTGFVLEWNYSRHLTVVRRVQFPNEIILRQKKREITEKVKKG